MEWTDLAATPQCNASEVGRTPNAELSDEQRHFRYLQNAAVAAFIQCAYRVKDGIASHLDLVNAYLAAVDFARAADAMKRYYDNLTAAERQRDNLPATWDLTKPDWQEMNLHHGDGERWCFVNAVMRMPEPREPPPSLANLLRMWLHGLAPLPAPVGPIEVG